MTDYPASKPVEQWLSYVRGTEAPTIYARWAAIMGTSTMMGRKTAISWADSDLFPNMYTMLVGHPACKKSTVITSVRRFLTMAGYECFAPDHISRKVLQAELIRGDVVRSLRVKSQHYGDRVAPIDRGTEDALRNKYRMPVSDMGMMSELLSEFENSVNGMPEPESPNLGTPHPNMDSVSGFLDSVMGSITPKNTNLKGASVYDDPRKSVMSAAMKNATPPKRKPSQCGIYTEEMIDTFPRKDPGILNTINMLWDCPVTYTEGVLQAYQPYMTMLTAMTPARFSEMFSMNQLSGGLLTRIIMVYAKPTERKVMPLDLHFNRRHQEDFIDALRVSADLSGAFKLDDDARRLLEDIYNQQPAIKDMRFDEYQQRRLVQLAKVSMCVAAWHNTLHINYDHVMYANTLLTLTEYHMPDALGEFVNPFDKLSAVQVALIKLLKQADSQILRTDEIVESLRTVTTESAIISEVIARLTSMGMLTATTVKDPKSEGKMTHAFILNERTIMSLAAWDGKLFDSQMVGEDWA